jgi:damage-control phosphatase, subfamily I
MPHMQIQPECRPCLERLIDLTVSLASSDPALQAEARRQARAVLAAEFSPAAISACIANKFHQIIKTVTGNPDPFLARKLLETEMARNLAGTRIAGWGSTPEAYLALAAAGNALDFFRPADEIAQDMLTPVHFTRSHLQLWQQQVNVQQPGLLLFLADNAGEQFFDLPLVQNLREAGWQVWYVVKGGPIQNDLCRRDLSDSGLEPVLEPVVDTGAPTVGLELARVSPEFHRLFNEADLILAKGMGHFETLSHLADRRLFFLLQAKCPPVAASLGVAVGSFVLRNACS